MCPPQQGLFTRGSSRLSRFLSGAELCHVQRDWFYGLRGGFYDQRVDDDRIEIDFFDPVGVICGKMREYRTEIISARAVLPAARRRSLAGQGELKDGTPSGVGARPQAAAMRLDDPPADR